MRLVHRKILETSCSLGSRWPVKLIEIAYDEDSGQ